MKIIPYEVKLIGRLETDKEETSSIYIDKIRLTDGENLLNLEDYDIDDDALDITISSLSYSIVNILIKEDLPLDEYISYIKELYRRVKDGEEGK